METGVLISLILGGAQILGSVLVLWSTKINSDVSKLKEQIKSNKQDLYNKQRTIERYARQIYFLRFVEESVYKELECTNTSYTSVQIKREVHSCMENHLDIKYQSLDSEIKQILDCGRSIKAIDISSYVK